MSDPTVPEAARGWRPQVGIVLGSGLGSFVDALIDAESLPYSEVPGLPQSAVPGHAGQFVYGAVGRVRAVAAQGRVHLYEGRDASEVCAGIRLMAAMGVRSLILTNAAGGIAATLRVGQWMMLSDHLNLTGTSPLLGGPNFHDMTEVYSAPWRRRFLEIAANAEIDLAEGVYAGLLGPQYETPAEVRMLRGLGADAVGMSTVLEAIQARALGLEVAGFSCITNAAAGMGSGSLDHGEVLAVGQRAAAEMAELLELVFEAEEFSA